MGRLDVVAFDCTDPTTLAGFYRAIIGGDLVTDPDNSWVELHTEHGRLAFQRIDDHRRATWPTGDVPQQAHVDIDVDDLDPAERAVVELGAVKADTQPAPDNFRVFFDPAGHPFCIVQPRSE